METRITVTLTSKERFALTKLAEKELRFPRDQLRVILSYELQKLGLLNLDEIDPKPDKGQEAAKGD